MTDKLDLAKLKQLIKEGYQGPFRMSLLDDETGEILFAFEGTLTELLLWIWEEHPEYIEGDSNTRATLTDLREGSRELWEPEN